MRSSADLVTNAVLRESEINFAVYWRRQLGPEQCPASTLSIQLKGFASNALIPALAVQPISAFLLLRGKRPR